MGRIARESGLVVTRIPAGASWMGFPGGTPSPWRAFSHRRGAAALGVLLGRRFVPARHALLLVAVPLLFLNVHQYEIFAGAVNLSYGAVPMVLLMAFCLAWFMPGDTERLMSIGVLAFLLIFSGFGLFAGLLAPPLLLVEAAQAWRSRERAHAMKALAALAITGVGWALFAHGYTFQPAVSGFRFPYERPLEYLVFVARMLGNFFGTAALSRTQLVAGTAAALGLLAIAVRNGFACFRKGVSRDPRSVVLFCLATFSLLFCANCAVGRVFTGPIAPLAPRYATLLIPAGLAIFLQFEEMASRARFAGLAVLFALLLVPATAVQRADEVYGANWFANGRRAWMAAYLKTHDEGQADRTSHFSIYPAPLGDRLKYLEDRHLNLFRQPVTGEPPAER